MFRIFVCINLILFVHVFCQTTENYFQLETDLSVTESWQEEISTDQSLQFHTDDETTQSWNKMTTEQPLEFNKTCPPSITPDMLEEMKREIIEAVLRNISREMTDRLEEMEARLSTLDRSNNQSSISSMKLSWLIYENLEIPLSGWSRVFDQPYSHKTRIDHLNQIAGICHNEVLVGATYNGSITLAAVGPANVLTLNTLWNQPQQFGQVYWYRNSGKSFGFSPTFTIRQTTGDNQDLDSPLRLSWSLDQDMGGYRAGVTRSLTDNALWHKIIYCK